MKLVVLGSGTSVPHSERAAAAFWLETESGSVLMDCGGDSGHRMAQEKLDWPNLDAIWISHLHLDHCGGLAPFLFGLRGAPQVRGRTRPLRIVGCQGITKLLKAIDEANHYRLFELRFPIEIQEVSGDAQFDLLPGLRAQTFSTPHTSESLALRLTGADGASIVYTSDTGYSEELAAFAQHADLLILECSFWRNKPTAKHLELAEAMQMAERAKPGKLLLAHLYTEWDGVDLEREAQALWPGRTVAAYDGLQVTIDPKPE